MSKPHDNVFTRLGVSKIHGIGVFAILPIKKGQYAFGRNEPNIVWVKQSSTKELPRDIRKLYKDFCVAKGMKFGCPESFNRLTPSWYLNHAVDPNMAADSNYEFYALRNIKKGEELTVDYRTYSE